MTGDIKTLIAEAGRRLAGVSPSPKLDVELLIAHELGKTREWVMAHALDLLPPSRLARIRTLVDRRAAGEPVAYLTGRRHFWNHEFTVTPDTLVPRPETELLVEVLLDTYDDTAMDILELGTGSGAIAVSLAAERPSWRVIATDNSIAALAVARENASNVGNIRFIESNWFESVDGHYDVIVSNPPYIRAGDEHLAALAFEPAAALVAGADGLDAIREIVRSSYHRLRDTGMLLLEHGYDQAPMVAGLMQSAGFTGIQALQDIQGHTRATLATT